MTDAVPAITPDPALDPAAALAAIQTPPTAATDTVPAGAAPASDQSPLDVLDQILKDAQGKAKEAVAEKSAEEAAKMEEERLKQRKLDADKVRQQLLGIAQAKESPEYQATLDQRKEEAQEQSEYQKKMDGMEIVQLEHTKL